MKQQFVILVIFHLICHVCRSIYEWLKSTNRVNPASKIIFGIMLVIMGGLWASWFMLCEIGPRTASLPPWISSLGLLSTAAGFILFFAALIRLKALENYRGDLVQDGVFSKLRHPMYLGFIFWIPGYALFRHSLVSLAVGIFTIPNILYWKHMEECELKKKYPQYNEYKKKTWF